MNMVEQKTSPQNLDGQEPFDNSVPAVPTGASAGSPPERVVGAPKGKRFLVFGLIATALTAGACFAFLRNDASNPSDLTKESAPEKSKASAFKDLTSSEEPSKNRSNDSSGNLALVDEVESVPSPLDNMLTFEQAVKVTLPTALEWHSDVGIYYALSYDVNGQTTSECSIDRTGRGSCWKLTYISGASPLKYLIYYEMGKLVKSEEDPEPFSGDTSKIVSETIRSFKDLLPLEDVYAEATLKAEASGVSLDCGYPIFDISVESSAANANFDSKTANSRYSDGKFIYPVTYNFEFVCPDNNDEDEWYTYDAQTGEFLKEI